MAKTRFLDELVNFLGDPIFQIPVRTFMDENCLTFDPEEGPSDDHAKIHEDYKQLVNALLQGFCTDAGVTLEEVFNEFSKMCSENQELKEYFEVLYDQVMASTDFNIFFGAMAKRNIVIQQQVLVMILAATGSMPASFSLDEGGAAAKKGAKKEDVLKATTDDRQEEDLLRQVMKASEEEHKKQKDLEEQEKEQLRRTLELSKAEAQALQNEKKQIEQKLEKLTLEAPPAPPTLAPVASSSKGKQKEPARAPAKPAAPAPLIPAPGAGPAPMRAPGAPLKPISGTDAANAWLSSAQEEAAKTSAAHAAVAKNMAKLTPEEIKQRQQFLMAQRDKLIAMKKDKREDQLKDAVKKQPQRPASARAARNAMGGGAGTPNQDDERALAMRRAIAEKIKQEVMK